MILDLSKLIKRVEQQYTVYPEFSVYKTNYGEYEILHKERGCVCVEMESFALFHNAHVLGKKAACILTISDSFVNSKVTSAEERQKSFTDMMEIALGTAVKLG